MADIKVNASPVLVKLLAGTQSLHECVGQQMSKHSVSEKFTTLKEHPTLKKVSEKKEFLWCFLGVALLFHGTQFSRILLCFQFVTTFCSTVCTTVTGMYSDLLVACEKAQADAAGDEHPAATTDDKSSKMSAKRDAKKAAEQAKQGQSAEKKAAAMAKLLKALSTEKVADAAFQIFAAFFACTLILRGGLPQSILLGHLLVQLFNTKVAEMVEFSGHDDLKAWTDLLLKAALYLVCTFVALLMPSVALAVIAAAFGIKLLSEHGLALATALGKGEKLESLLGSQQGLMVMLGVAAFGTLWQIWVLSSGMSWYLKALYLPGVIAEASLRVV